MELSSPIKEIPDCWKDEKRMNSLFAPFRKKELNPVDWESKMKFWHSVIEKWCFEKNQACFSGEIIKKQFKRNDRMPVCIETAIEELVRCEQVKNKNDFLATDPSESWTSWAVNSLVKAPVSWSMSKLKSAWIQPEGILPETEFVHLAYLKEKGDELFSVTESLNEDLVSIKDITDILSKDAARVSDDTVNCIVQWLHTEKKATVQTVNDTKLVKFFRTQGSAAGGKTEISQADLAIFKLQQNKAVLAKNLEHLEVEKEKCVEDARAYLRKGLEKSAKSCLRKKKELEKCIEKRAVTLDNLESLLSSLRNTESDSKVVDAYKVGLAALKGTFKNSGLSEEGVFETMAQLQEMNEIQDEIQMAISQPVLNLGGDEEFEKELADILAKQETTATSITVLPDVPDHSLGSIDTKTSRKETAPHQAL